MKKKWVLSFLLSGLLLFTGCQTTTEKIKETSGSTEQEEVTERFKKGTVETTDYRIKIIDSTMTYGHDEELNLIVFTYEFTNLSNKLLAASDQFNQSFGASQELDDTVETLDASLPPYNSAFNTLYDKGLSKVKPEKTITAVAVYKLIDSKKSVVLSAYNTKSGREIGRKTFIPDIALEETKDLDDL
ncbi:DUF5067 domain-containing protein [Enterococcus sp. BWR-S5]|uniref:DUF5067 domain-containing protein n=1 Tax=Enterococcus sp. BWR-S5 TaxID=2787714 RepID=UPI0019221120|nr:DUF5067 domain-containing protein [Enterococcus sp. BWR-S5]MBL1225278.1 DUF5067 domain-containing protein [Enterococcus sp. BWR-S5]